jgi:lipoic acid synthetase
MPARERLAPVLEMLRDLGLHTVCQSAHCPNIGECFARGTATFMILGGVCTRSCRFCAVEGGRPAAPDPDEPARVAEATRRLGLRHVVVTSVTRDDLPDGGAGHWAATIRALRAAGGEGLTVEVLTPDFGGDRAALAAVAEAGPAIFNHNVETVPRLYAEVRPEAVYGRSLAVLRGVSEGWGGIVVKSGLMLGMGERDDELRGVLVDLRAAGCSALTLGQYLSPSARHYPVARFVGPEEFERWGEEARAMGFRAVASGPMVRSSFQADRMAAELAGGASGAE